MTMEKETKILCYELDFGDANIISPSRQEILDWISADMDTIKEEPGPLMYKIGYKMLTQEEINALPEWQ